MTLHINESEVRSLLTMAMALEAVEDSLRKQAHGEVVVQPRRRFELPNAHDANGMTVCVAVHESLRARHADALVKAIGKIARHYSSRLSSATAPASAVAA